MFYQSSDFVHGAVDYATQVDYRPNPSMNYYNRNTEQPSGYAFAYRAILREHVRELETVDIIGESMETNPSTDSKNSAVFTETPQYIRCKSDDSTTRAPIVGTIKVGPGSSDAAPPEGKHVFLEVDTDFASSTSFTEGENSWSVEVDVGGFLLDVVQIGSTRYSGSSYLKQATSLFTGVVRPYVRGNMIAKVTFTLNHAGWVSEKYDNFVASVRAAVQVNTLNNRIQRDDNSVHSSVDLVARPRAPPLDFEDWTRL